MRRKQEWAADLVRRENLRWGTEIRERRARLKEHIAEGDLRVSEVLSTDKVHLHTMKAADLLLAVPGLGPTKVNRAFRALNISPSVKLENLPHRRRQELLAWLESHHRTVEL